MLPVTVQLGSIITGYLNPLATTKRNRCGPVVAFVASNSQWTASDWLLPLASSNHGASIFTPCPDLLVKRTAPLTNSTRVPALNSLSSYAHSRGAHSFCKNRN